MEKEEEKEEEYRVRQRGCSLTHNARTPPAVHPGIMIWVDKIKIEIYFGGRAIFLKFFKSIFLLLNGIVIEKK